MTELICLYFGGLLAQVGFGLEALRTVPKEETSVSMVVAVFTDAILWPKYLWEAVRGGDQ